MSPILTKDEICATLSNNSTQEWHWALCIPLNEESVQKYHAKQVSNTGWLYESKPHILATSATCSAVIKIGALKSGITIETIDGLLRSIPLSMPAAEVSKEPYFNCRLWFREAVRTLHVNGIIDCPNVDQLEQECRDIAKQNDRTQAGTNGFIYSKANGSK